MADLVKLVRTWAQSRNLRENATEMENRYKALLMQALEQHGETDDSGSYFLELPEAVEVGEGETAKTYRAIKRERRVSRSLDEDAARSILEPLGLYQECLRTIEVFDEDALLALQFTGKISDEQLKAMYTEGVTWAFKPR